MNYSLREGIERCSEFDHGRMIITLLDAFGRSESHARPWDPECTARSGIKHGKVHATA